MNKNILITGGAGFIGSSLAERLLKNPEYFVVVVDNLSTGSIKKLPDASVLNFKFIHCDVNNYDDIAPIMMSYKFDYVFHYAATVGVQRTQKHPLQVLDDIDGFRNICKLSTTTKVKRIFFSSSSEVYGEPFEIPQRVDTTPLNSRVPYAVVKNLGEAYLRSYYQEFGLEYSIFRFFNTYGIRQSSDFVMSKFILKALKNEDIKIFGDGLQTRTFCYIDDNIEACVNAFEKNLLINKVANIGGDQEIAIKDLANIILRKTNSSSKIIYMPPLKDGDMRRRCPDNQYMKEVLLNNHPLVKLEEGIDKMIKQGLFEMR